MSSSAFNILDYILSILMIWIIIVAFFRGLVYELRSLVALLLALLLTYLLVPHVYKYLSGFIISFVKPISFFLSFLITWIMASLMLRLILSKVEMSGGINSILGVLIGLFKAGFLLGLFFATMDTFLVQTNSDNIISNSYLRNILLTSKISIFYDICLSVVK